VLAQAQNGSDIPGLEERDLGKLLKRKERKGEEKGRERNGQGPGGQGRNRKKRWSTLESMKGRALHLVVLGPWPS
jgi:hypothetical protein